LLIADCRLLIGFARPASVNDFNNRTRLEVKIPGIHPLFRVHIEVAVFVLVDDFFDPGIDCGLICNQRHFASSQEQYARRLKDDRVKFSINFHLVLALGLRKVPKAGNGGGPSPRYYYITVPDCLQAGSDTLEGDYQRISPPKVG
jgi:hypothetical protein